MENFLEFIYQFLMKLFSKFSKKSKSVASMDSSTLEPKIPIKEQEFYFGTRSKKNLAEAHIDLQRLFNEVIKEIDCTVIEGHRPKAEQDRAYRAGNSKLRWPRSKHNKKPSFAVDVVPYPIDWRDTKRFYEFGKIVIRIAREMNIKIRWGGDWDGDGDYKDQSFNDLVHFEIKT